jgi:uncharacterized protein
MLGRLLILAGAVWLLILLLRPSRHAVPPRQPDTDDMVRCKHCGVHLPKSESVTRDGDIYCCTTHRDADR